MSCFCLNMVHENSLVRFNRNNNGYTSPFWSLVLHGTNRDKSLRHGELWHLAAKSKNGVTSNPRASQSASFAIHPTET